MIAICDIPVGKSQFQLIANTTGSRTPESMPGMSDARTDCDRAVDRESFEDEGERGNESEE